MQLEFVSGPVGLDQDAAVAVMAFDGTALSASARVAVQPCSEHATTRAVVQRGARPGQHWVTGADTRTPVLGQPTKRHSRSKQPSDDPSKSPPAPTSPGPRPRPRPGLPRTARGDRVLGWGATCLLQDPQAAGRVPRAGRALRLSLTALSNHWKNGPARFPVTGTSAGAAHIAVEFCTGRSAHSRDDYGLTCSF